jgi:23S rRNA pseudouridine1911/1915/1917 synthase
VRLGWALSRRKAKELIADGKVTVNGRHIGKGATVAPGDNVLVNQAPQSLALEPNARLKIEVLYEDASVLVVNKPGSIPCHPLKPGEQDTVINAVVADYPEVAQIGDKPLEGGLVHRLDNGTSGALIIARNPDAFALIRRAIRCGNVSRRYLALCAVTVAQAGEISTPIAHHPKNRRKMITIPLDTALAGAQPAATIVEPLERLSGSSLIEVQPRTGRRHQIRIHLKSIGYPLLGDTLYGGQEVVELAPGRFWLHLSEVEFQSPSNGTITVHAPLPSDLEAVLTRLGS